MERCGTCGVVCYQDVYCDSCKRLFGDPWQHDPMNRNKKLKGNGPDPKTEAAKSQDGHPEIDKQR